jgi:hypothetical protein
MLESDKDENLPKVSLTTIMCTRQTRKKGESWSHNEVIGQKEVQPSIVNHTPPHLSNNCNIQNSRGEKPTISNVTIT